MAHLHRFFVEDLTGEFDRHALTGDEGHHAARVARVREGDPVALINGRGECWTGPVASVDKRSVDVSIADYERVEPPSPSLTLCAAMLDLDKTTESMVRRATDLGVTRFVFYRAQHSQKPAKIKDKWRRLAVESIKQCGRLWLPTFETAENVEALSDLPDQRFILSLDDDPMPMRDALRREDVAILVGPEGDFTEHERAYAIEQGWRPISLGDTIFKADVATIVATTIIQYEWGNLGPQK